MTTTSATNFYANILILLCLAIKYNKPVGTCAEEESAIIISNEDRNCQTDTELLSSIPQMREKIIEGLHTPLDECLQENEVEW